MLGGDGSPGLARLGQAAFARSWGPEQGASRGQQGSGTWPVACSGTTFSDSSLRGPPEPSGQFLCGLEPRGRISGPVGAPLAASLIGGAAGDEEDAAVKYLATLVDVW